MKALKSIGTVLCLLLGLVTAVIAQDGLENQTKTSQDMGDTSQEFLESLVGSWRGTCRTWFRPDELADESVVSGRFEVILGRRFLRHSYEGEIKGQPRNGEETIAFNAVDKTFQTSWIDDFHTSDAILYSEGYGTENGFVVLGQYAVGLNMPPWGWRTVFELTDDDHLTMTAFNVSPEGMEAKALETKYVRVKP